MRQNWAIFPTVNAKDNILANTNVSSLLFSFSRLCLMILLLRKSVSSVIGINDRRAAGIDMEKVTVVRIALTIIFVRNYYAAISPIGKLG